VKQFPIDQILREGLTAGRPAGATTPCPDLRPYLGLPLPKLPKQLVQHILECGPCAESYRCGLKSSEPRRSAAEIMNEGRKSLYPVIMLNWLDSLVRRFASPRLQPVPILVRGAGGRSPSPKVRGETQPVAPQIWGATISGEQVANAGTLLLRLEWGQVYGNQEKMIARGIDSRFVGYAAFAFGFVSDPLLSDSAVSEPGGESRLLALLSEAAAQPEGPATNSLLSVMGTAKFCVRGIISATQQPQVELAEVVFDLPPNTSKIVRRLPPGSVIAVIATPIQN